MDACLTHLDSRVRERSSCVYEPATAVILPFFAQPKYTLVLILSFGLSSSSNCWRSRSFQVPLRSNIS